MSYFSILINIICLSSSFMRINYMLLLSVFIVFTSAEEITCLWVVDPKGMKGLREHGLLDKN